MLNVNEILAGATADTHTRVQNNNKKILECNHEETLWLLNEKKNKLLIKFYKKRKTNSFHKLSDYLFSIIFDREHDTNFRCFII